MSDIREETLREFGKALGAIAGDPRFDTASEELLGKWSRVCRRYDEMSNAVDAHRKPDRSALLRMAGNIAAGIAPAYVAIDTYDAKKIARQAADVARAIMTEIDNPQTDKEQIR